MHVPAGAGPRLAVDEDALEALPPGALSPSAVPRATWTSGCRRTWPAEQADDRRCRERELRAGLQRDGRWGHLWRIVGRYANASIFDVGSHDELHDLLSGLPLFPYMDIVVTPLARHPSAIDQPEERRDS